MRFEVHPIYGWGWRREDSAIELPSDFEIEATDVNRENGSIQRLNGRILQANHPFDGAWISAMRRTGDVNEIQCGLLIRQTEPPWKDDGTLYSDAETIAGYGVVRTCEEG